MSVKKILPPFPFPNSWDLVRSYQNHRQFVMWSVPSYSIEALRAHCFQNPVGVDMNIENENASTALIEHYSGDNIELQDDQQEDEVLVMNEEWIERFSKTLKRKQKKAYKANKKSSKY